MSKLSTAWTGAVAYVSLLTGSGLSVAGNVADTFRTRGDATDGLDIILAGAWPILVILTIEMFVSRRWSPSHGFQVLRWFGCLAIGSLAMLVSWLHLHDLMASRGQLPLVAMAGPLAIDGMAIMATGLILSTRGRVTAPEAPAVHRSAVIVPVTQEDLDDRLDEASLARLDESLAPGGWLARLQAETDGIEPVSAVPVSPAPRSNEVKPESVPADAVDLIMAWSEAGSRWTTDDDGVETFPKPSAGDVDVLLAAHFNRQPRTIRRWRDAIKNR